MIQEVNIANRQECRPEDQEPNIIICMSGILSACEDQVLADVAAEIGAEYIDLEQVKAVRSSLSPEPGTELPSKDRILARMTLGQLLKGRDVVTDMHLNSPHQRTRAIEPIANLTGALTVGLNFEVDEKTALSRMTDWVDHGYVFDGGQTSRAHMIDIYRSMSYRLAPICPEEVDYLYQVNGNNPAEMVTDFILTRLEDDKLIDLVYEVVD